MSFWFRRNLAVRNARNASLSRSCHRGGSRRQDINENVVEMAWPGSSSTQSSFTRRDLTWHGINQHTKGYGT